MVIHEFSGDFIQWLRGFYYTTQTGSMSAASELMNRNQSTITQQIKCLEEELGVKLFTGPKGKRVLTAEGKLLLSKAVQLFGVLSEIVDGIGQVTDNFSGEITMACFYTLMEFYLPDKVTAFNARNPDITVRVSGSSQREKVFEKIYSREYDFGLMDGESVPPEFEFEPLFSSEMVLLSPPDGPWAISRLPSLDCLSHLPLIAHPDTSSLEPFLQHQFARMGLSLRSRHMISHCGALKRYVAKGLGAAVVDRFICLPEDYGLMNIVSLDQFFPKRTFGVIRRREMYLSAHVEAFLKYLTANSGAPAMAGEAEADEARTDD